MSSSIRPSGGTPHYVALASLKEHEGEFVTADRLAKLLGLQSVHRVIADLITNYGWKILTHYDYIHDEQASYTSYLLPLDQDSL